MTGLDRVAVVSDVHGNLTAYQAVLADIDARGITRVVNLGDVVGKGPRGAECVRLTREREIATVQGNWEAFRSTGADGPAAWWWDQLDPDQRIWVAALPFHHDLVLSGRRVRMLHASPQGVSAGCPTSTARRTTSGCFSTPSTPFGIQFVRVPFDTEAEIAVALGSGMPEAQEYAIELRTGLYRGYQQGA